MAQGGVIGTGVDLIETARIERMFEKWGPAFRDRVFLASEQAYCESKGIPARHYAGRFAVKEALVKALGTGIGPQAAWLDVEVCRNDQTGAPSVRLSGAAARTARHLGVGNMHVSLSHTRDYAVAQVILTGGE